jgi:hypothetical protein
MLLWLRLRYLLKFLLHSLLLLLPLTPGTLPGRWRSPHAFQERVVLAAGCTQRCSQRRTGAST